MLAVDGRTALLFHYLDAPVATRATLRERYDEAAAVLAGLHEDRGLAALLGSPTTTGDCFREVWLTRFEADLDIIEGFVAKDLHAYLTDEVDALGILVDELDEPVHAAVHGDPWHQNWLIAPDRLWLLDWEDLSVGDPAVDDAVLRYDGVGTDPHHWPDEPVHTVARRLLMLEAVVDVAADWVENTDPLVRRRKEAAYLAGLEAYRVEDLALGLTEPAVPLSVEKHDEAEGHPNQETHPGLALEVQHQVEAEEHCSDATSTARTLNARS